MLSSLLEELQNQVQESNAHVEILVHTDSKEISIGRKRNHLLARAKGEYLCFFDDDDKPSKSYINNIIKALQTKPDCCSLRGIITWNGERPEVFEHSLRYTEWETKDGPIKYLRPPNHLNTIKSSIAKKFEFEDISHGEDKIWSIKMRDSGLLQTETYIDAILYHYLFIENKNT